MRWPKMGPNGGSWQWRQLDREIVPLVDVEDASELERSAARELRRLGFEVRHEVAFETAETNRRERVGEGTYIGRTVSASNRNINEGEIVVNGNEVAEPLGEISGVRFIVTDEYAISGPFFSLLPDQFFEGLTDVSMGFQVPGVADLESLSRAPILYDLRVPLTDAHAAALSGLARLKTLTCVGGTFGDTLFRELPVMPDIGRLMISSVNCGDETVEQLGKFPSLMSLGIGGTAVTDRGVRRLLEVLPRSSGHVHLPFETTSKDAVNGLMAAWPELQVWRFQRWG